MRSREEELTDGDWRKCIDRVQTRGSEDLGSDGNASRVHEVLRLTRYLYAYVLFKKSRYFQMR
jgi:hypothetical protein